ncbi:winged helix-turn-helix domain-containing protein [Candidatus Enterococcus palustris]|nr:winged helix-turn-helix domain-containing protein [Enterococcus sp. 7F3_DIV0205]
MSNLNKLQAIVAFENEISDVTKLCEMILAVREQSDCYIFIVSTNPNDTGKMIYLRLGVDFVFTENHHELEEILLVMNNTFSRNRKEVIRVSNEDKKEMKSSKLFLIHSNFSVLIEGVREVALTRLEFQTLNLLAEKPKVAFSYEEIYRELYQEKLEGNRTYRVANIIFHLRKKIEVSTNRPMYIKTVRSKGYMLDI